MSYLHLFCQGATQRGMCVSIPERQGDTWPHFVYVLPTCTNLCSTITHMAKHKHTNTHIQTHKHIHTSTHIHPHTHTNTHTYLFKNLSHSDDVTSLSREEVTNRCPKKLEFIQTFLLMTLIAVTDLIKIQTLLLPTFLAWHGQLS